MKRLTLLSSVLLLAAVLAAAGWLGRRPRPVAITPSLTGKEEYCLTCHDGLSEISPSHPLETFGCVLCHGGERLALDANLAHSTLRGGANPSDLAVVEQSCGGSVCHSGEAAQERDHIQRVMSSLQATYAGAIANIRFTFGAQPDLKARFGVLAALASTDSRPRLGEPQGPETLEEFDPQSETSPGVLAFAENCLECHLSASPAAGAPERERLTGCAACHTPAYRLSAPGARTGSTGVHRLTTVLPYTQCNTCHNRGNYDLRSMQFVPRLDHPGDRLHDYYQPIAQFTRCEYELDCLDCHTRGEVMGDGHLYNNQKDLQYVQCRTCHGTLEELPKTRLLRDPDDIALRMAFLNPQVGTRLGDTIVVTEAGEPLWNIRQEEDGEFELIGKVSGTRYALPLVKGSACEQKPDEQESRYCHACHAVEH